MMPYESRILEVIANTPPTIEGSIADAAVDILHCAGNHAGKLATILALTTFPESEHATGSELTDRVNELQGSEPGWHFDRYNMPLWYCKNALSPAKLVSFSSRMDTSTRGRKLETVQLNDSELAAGVTVAGALLHFVIESGGILQELNGVARTSKNAADANPIRLAIYNTLRQHPQGIASISELEKGTGRSSATVIRAVRDLCKAGILQQTHKFDRGSRVFILEEVPPDTGKSSRLSPETATVIEAAAQLQRDGKTRVTGKDILDTALGLDPAASQRAVWGALLSWMRNPDRYQLNFLKEVPVVKDRRYRTAIQIADAWRPHIDELFRVRDLLTRSDQEALDFQAAARRHALETVTTPRLMAQVLSTVRVQRKADADNIAWTLAVERHLPPEGAYIAKLHQMIEEATGENVPYDQFRAHVGRLKHIDVRLRERQDADRSGRAISYASLKQFPADWGVYARCDTHDIDPDLFFPIGTKTAEAIEQAEEAKQVCHACPVRLACLRQAVALGEKQGIRGGIWLEHPEEALSEERRQEILRLVRIKERLAHSTPDAQRDITSAFSL